MRARVPPPLSMKENMFYINKSGLVIEALQWDGSEESLKKIEKKFKIKITKEKVFSFIKEEYKIEHRIAGAGIMFINKNDYAALHPVTNEFVAWSYEFFNKYFKNKN